MDVVENEQLTPEQAFAHWYYVSKFELLLRHLVELPRLHPASSVADVGCGIGLFLSMLERQGRFDAERMVGIDPAYPQPRVAIAGTARILPDWPEGEKFDLALMMDVLEHVPDDLAVLNETVARVRPGGTIFITVPAFRWLRSAHDRFLGHYRRYSLGELQSLVGGVPEVRIERAHYFFGTIFPLAAVWRLASKFKREASRSDMSELPRLANSLLTAVHRAELRLAGVNRLFGLTAVVRCVKSDS